MRKRYPIGEYVPLHWDGDGEPAAHYVSGHVTPDEFRAEIKRWFSGSSREPTIPPEAKILHVQVITIRGPDDPWGNRVMEWRHCGPGRGQPMTYWEVSPNRNTGA